MMKIVKMHVQCYPKTIRMMWVNNYLIMGKFQQKRKWQSVCVFFSSTKILRSLYVKSQNLFKHATTLLTIFFEVKRLQFKPMGHQKFDLLSKG